MTDSQASEAPALISRGQYALYESPDGGMHLSYRPSDTPDDAGDTHLPIPAAIVALGRQMSQGASPVAMARQLMNLRRGAKI